MPFSFTAPSYSKEDQEREYSSLSPEQKEDILNDAYGRNAEEIAELNEREITQHELDAFDEALESLPPEVNTESAIAAKTVICPGLVERESNPSLFLRRENYNPQKAAKRFAAYWDFRVDLLGTEKAFLPISLAEGGAYHDEEEVIRMMRESPTYRCILPNDKHGRSVMYVGDDQCVFHRQEKIKYVFYAMHRLMKQQSSISKGVVFIAMINDEKGLFKLHKFDRILYKQTAKLERECIPFKFRTQHIIAPSRSLSVDLLIPAATYFWSQEVRLRFFYHNLYGQPKISFLRALEPYGFRPEGLPESLGGTYQFNISWVEEHMNEE